MKNLLDVNVINGELFAIFSDDCTKAVRIAGVNHDYNFNMIEEAENVLNYSIDAGGQEFMIMFKMRNNYQAIKRVWSEGIWGLELDTTEIYVEDDGKFILDKNYQ